MSPLPKANLILPSGALRKYAKQTIWPITLDKFEDGNDEIIMDYGHCEGGIPVFNIISATAEDGIREVRFRVTYSETIDGIDCEHGDGPFFLFSNAMDSYRVNDHTIPCSSTPQISESRYLQGSQRYQKIALLSPRSTVVFSSIGFQPLRPKAVPKAFFHCSDPVLNKIWNDGVRTVDMCTVRQGETKPAWDVTNEGSKVYGGHWAPCREGSRWTNKKVTFQTKIEEGGVSWAVHMVANGLIFCLDARTKTLEAHQGLSHQSTMMPSVKKGSWEIPNDINLDEWIQIEMVTFEDNVVVSVGGCEVAALKGLDLMPLLGGSGKNSGSIAFGGPAGWTSTHRNLHVTDLHGSTLYKNTLTASEAERTYADFQVGTNSLACTIDGAKRDRACFGGDSHVMGRSIAYSTGDMKAWRGSLQLLTSHQTKDGYLGNLCPIQAPQHEGQEEPPTYAFYSLGYALLTIVSMRDYWLHSGDLEFMQECFPRLQNQIDFAAGFVNDDGLVEAPPPLSMTWFPMGGPIFGPSASINIAYYDALKAMADISVETVTQQAYTAKAVKLKEAIVSKLWDPQSTTMRPSFSSPPGGFDQHVQAYAMTTGIAPTSPSSLARLFTDQGRLPLAFQGLGHWDNFEIISPYATGFAVEALFATGKSLEALDLLRRVWGIMADETRSNYSGAHWEAMKSDGQPFSHDVSLVHAWSTWPVFLLPKYLAGLRAIRPGWEEVEICPLLADVERVEYRLETSWGLTGVRLVMDEAREKCVVDLDVPCGVTAWLRAPAGWTLEGPEKNVGSGKTVSLQYRRS